MLAAFTAVLGFVALDQDTHHLDPSLDRRVDWVGATFVTIGLVLLMFALGDGETAEPHQWRSGYIIAMLVVSVVLLAAFIWWEYMLEVGHPDSEEGQKSTRAPPLLKLSIFKRAHGKLAATLCLAFFVWAGFTGWMFYAVVSLLCRFCVMDSRISNPSLVTALVSPEFARARLFLPLESYLVNIS